MGTHSGSPTVSNRACPGYAIGVFRFRSRGRNQTARALDCRILGMACAGRGASSTLLEMGLGSRVDEAAFRSMDAARARLSGFERLVVRGGRLLPLGGQAFTH